MADDPLTKFARKFGAKSPTASSKPPSSAERVPDTDADDRDNYEAFDNKVRPVCLEIRCNRSGLSYSLPYGHMGAIIFDFRTGRNLMFTGCGLTVKIKGQALGEIARAIRLHTCALIQDCPEGSMSPVDPNASFVESVTVEVMRSPAPAKASEDA
jgi:hypothetical protein